MASSVVLLVLLLAFLAVGAAAAATEEEIGKENHPDPEARIINGDKVNIEMAPWTATTILFGKDKGCGGTVISDRWILSAAHCFYNKKEDQVTVRLGSSTIADGGKVYGVEKIVNHEAYNNCQAECQNDIAALRTSSRIIFGATVASARLPDADSPPLPVGTKLQVLGWGRTNSVIQCNNTYSPVLMAVEIEVVDFEGCAEQCGMGADESLHICAGGQGKNACKGDSGGPLVKGDLLVGIVSCGNTADCAAKPAIYTKVTVFRDWIRNVTGV